MEAGEMMPHPSTSLKLPSSHFSATSFTFVLHLWALFPPYSQLLSQATTSPFGTVSSLDFLGNGPSWASCSLWATQCWWHWLFSPICESCGSWKFCPRISSLLAVHTYWTLAFPKEPCPIPKKGNAKECSNYRTIALVSHASKVMLKILQARLQQYVNHELPVFKLVLGKAEEPETKLTTSAGSSKKQESSRKTSIFALLTMPRPLTVWITINCGKFWNRWVTRPPDLPLEKFVFRSRSNS